MRLLAEDVAACEHAASCMYSMAREHAPSKVELIKVGAHKKLAEVLRGTGGIRPTQDTGTTRQAGGRAGTGGATRDEGCARSAINEGSE